MYNILISTMSDTEFESLFFELEKNLTDSEQHIYIQFDVSDYTKIDNTMTRRYALFLQKIIDTHPTVKIQNLIDIDKNNSPITQEHLLHILQQPPVEGEIVPFICVCCPCQGNCEKPSDDICIGATGDAAFAPIQYCKLRFVEKYMYRYMYNKTFGCYPENISDLDLFDVYDIALDMFSGMRKMGISPYPYILCQSAMNMTSIFTGIGVASDAL